MGPRWGQERRPVWVPVLVLSLPGAWLGNLGPASGICLLISEMGTLIAKEPDVSYRLGALGIRVLVRAWPPCRNAIL